MSYKKYLRTDGTMTGWITEPESDTDREVYTLLPMRRAYKRGETIGHIKLGVIECVKCERLINEDQCGEWNGPSFIGEFVSVGADNL
jgi:hypothetical protein